MAWLPNGGKSLRICVTVLIESINQSIKKGLE